MTDVRPAPRSVPPRGLDAASAVSRDGTTLAVYATPLPRVGARTLVLAPGLGAPPQAWAPIIAYLADRYRVVTWDYRGLYGSGRPVDLDAGFAIERHVDDLEAVLAATGTVNAAVVGWSMGAQVALEAYRRAPRSVTALVLVNGTFGRPHASANAGVWALDRALPILRVARRHPGATRRLAGALLKRPELTTWLGRLGLVGVTAHDSGLDEAIRRIGTVDLDAYLRNLEALGEHDASRILPSVQVPVLVITGDRDVLTSYGLSQRMVRRLPKAELLRIEGGTHFTPLEFPELVGLRIERFLREQGFGP